MRDRRLLIALGAVLLVGGWGVTQFIHEEQMAIPMRNEDSLPRLKRWYTGTVTGPYKAPRGRVIYRAGVLGMALGAGLIGFGVFPKKE